MEVNFIGFDEFCGKRTYKINGFMGGQPRNHLETQSLWWNIWVDTP
jgi:hypothetical protein